MSEETDFRSHRKKQRDKKERKENALVVFVLFNKVKHQTNKHPEK